MPSAETRRRTPETPSRDILARQRTVTETPNGISEQFEIWRRGDNAKAFYDIRQARVLLVQPLEKGESERATRISRSATSVYSALDIFFTDG